VYLPVGKSNASEETAGGADKRAHNGRETVLLVEDDTDLRFLTRKSLERFGYSVIEAGAGPSALELWRASRDEIDVVVTDVIMPDGMTGVDLARTIEREKKTSQSFSSVATIMICWM
jgi:hypothetical protein